MSLGPVIQKNPWWAEEHGSPFGTPALASPPQPSNWMNALNLLGATLKDYSNHGRTNNIASTQDAIRGHGAAVHQGLPPDAPNASFGTDPPVPEPSNWMHALNLFGATLKDYSNHGRTNNVALTQDAIRAHRAAQDRIAPFLPPNINQAMLTARLSGHYDPAAGKYSIPALGVWSGDEQRGLTDGQMPSPYGQVQYSDDDLSAELPRRPWHVLR